MAVKGSNFRPRRTRLTRAYFVAVNAGDQARVRTIRLAFWRLTDHIVSISKD